MLRSREEEQEEQEEQAEQGGGIQGQTERMPLRNSFVTNRLSIGFDFIPQLCEK
jgi:hypothetical protein